jgi:phosphoribosylformimino-5-aminoimidazole carboxamide ribotide isomerase
MKIIPAIDILNGKLVRLEKGEYQSYKVYSENPFKVTRQFSENGFDLIHIVDLAGSKDGRINTLDLVNLIKSKLKIKIQFGGGIRTLNDVERLINYGVDKIVIGSISVIEKNEFEKILNKFHPDKIVVAIDSEDEIIKIKGWTENSGVNIYNHINYCLALGVNTFLCTDIKKDGMLAGVNNQLYKKLQTKYPEIKIIASGGVSKIEDVKSLQSQNLYAVVIGKAIYENKIELKELRKIAG